MAYQGNLAEWLLSQKDKIDFGVTEYTWVEDFAPNYSDFGVRLGPEIIGRAIDRNPETALNKAIAEGIERATCLHNGLMRSTGVAAHPDREVAFLNAKRELIERIAFDWHFSQRQPFKKIEPQTSESRHVQKTFLEMGIEFLFFRLISPPELNVICATAFGKNFKRPFGAMFGFGCNEEAADAERAALFEALRNAAYYTQDHNTEDLPVTEFQKIVSPKFFDRFRLGLNLEYLKKIYFLFGDANSKPEWFPEITISQQEMPKAPMFESAPLIIMRADSDYQFQRASDELPSFMD